ncbi:Protein CBG26629 [Caenorhabditis briggsae]|uniref:Protein CBG26629 n=1 Tax=Caenorhabditis briggsae TaxID=6238 RepID=B6ILJ9_CAEBR|nr:Protein CBG26629 [Caenorhabditis briggsae]CAS00779.1 Protein CBG26629 [Caenorhabditis briggsae]
MELAKVNCGWKGCSNAFASIEGMNVHVQADHMVYRVLVQTEYQGNSHVQQPYDQQQQAARAAAVPQIMHVKEEARAQETTPPQSPLELQGGAPPAPAAPAAPQPIAHPSIPPYSPMTTHPAQTPSLVLAPQLLRTQKLRVLLLLPPAASSGALILNTPPPADVTLAASGDFSRGGATSSSLTRRISTGGGRGKIDKKNRNYHSKYWSYTDQESYRCNAKSCGAEFSSANAVRLHWNANHELAPIENRAAPSTSIVRAPASRKRAAGGGARRSASGNRSGTRRQRCNRDGCTKYFMSKKALENHIQVLHADQEEEQGGLDQHSDDEEFEHQHVVASDDTEHGDEQHEQELHRGDEYDQEEEEEEDLQLGQEAQIA